MIPTIRMHRFEWIIRNAENPILDIGSNESSMWISRMWYPQYPDNITNPISAVFFDCDVWIPQWLKYPKFVRGDANKLPFKDRIFNTVILGDILEHVHNPEIVLQEAKRVCKRKIVITIPNEVNFPDHLKKPEICEPNDDDLIDGTINHPSVLGKCYKVISETKLRHHTHLQQFDDEGIIKLLDSLNMEYSLFKLKYGFKNDELTTFGIVMWRN